MPSEESLAAFRHIIHVARTGRVQVTAATSEVCPMWSVPSRIYLITPFQYIQNDFVTDRQRDPASTNTDDLIRRMAFAK